MKRKNYTTLSVSQATYAEVSSKLEGRRDKKHGVVYLDRIALHAPKLPKGWRDGCPDCGQEDAVREGETPGTLICGCGRSWRRGEA